jgi:tetratricopeptide (TPR) repeat protein
METSQDHEKNAFLNLMREGRQDEAASMMSDALNKDFDNAGALYNLAQCYKDAERFGHAFNLYRASAAMQESADAYNGMGLCFQETWKLDDAEKCYRQALRIDPNHAHVLNNMGLVYLHKCDPDESLKWLSRALKADPQIAGAVLNRAYALLMKQQWKEGWRDWQHILGRVKARSEVGYDGEDGKLLPRWNGEKGKRVIVYGEQGIGDEISFASCIPDLVRDSEKVYIDCDSRLEGLFRRSFKAEVYGTRFTKGIPPISADYRCAIGDLPRFYRNAETEFPGTPYLVPDPERRVQWRALLDTYKRPAIGIAWTGGTALNGAAKRSLPLSAFKPILDSVDATWVSLEYKDRGAEATQFGVKDWERGTRTKDYDDTAALVAELDLVISVTTAVVHLAGAVGKEAWVLVPSKPRWFYGLKGETSPWYSSVKFYRQCGSVWPIDEIARKLKQRYE